MICSSVNLLMRMSVSLRSELYPKSKGIEGKQVTLIRHQREFLEMSVQILHGDIHDQTRGGRDK